MNHHPAAEMVAIALRKIQKIANNKKYQPLLDQCQAFLDNIHQILPPAGAAAVPAAPTASSSPQASVDAGAASSDSLAAAAADVPAAASPAPAQQADAVPGDELPDEPPAQPVPAETEQPAADSVPEVVPTEVPSDTSTATAAPVPAPGPAPEVKAKPLPDMVPRTASALPDSVALKMVAVLRLAVNTERPQIIEVALDCLKKLIAFKFLQGAVYVINMEKKGPKQDVMDSDKHTAVSPDDPNTKTPQAQAVELLCRCDDIPDKEVEESVLGGLLTATTSSTFTLHGQALLLAVRACYNIYLTSRVDQSQTAAKATLTQMLNVVFRRMEADEVLIEVKPIVFADMLGMARPSSMPDATTMVVANVQAFLNNVVMVAGGPTLQTPDELRASVAGALAASHDDHVHSAAMDTAGDASPKKPSLPGALLIPQHQHNASDSTGGIAKHHGLVLNTHQQTPEETARSAVLRNDAFLVFRGLCKLSIRTSDTQDPAAVRGKVLALELLKVLLENSGPTFRRSETFISAIRQYLCLSLLKNSSSSVLAATQLSCSIFLSLMSKFRSQLKAEVGVFFPMILLKPFEPVGPGGAPLPPAAAAAYVGPPPTIASLQYKSTILRVLSEVCRDGQLLVDLFVNYDCDLESVNLFERMVNALVKLAQQAPIAQPPSPLIVDTGNTYHQEMYVRQEALQALVHLVEAMLHWYKLTVNLVEVDLGSTDILSTPGPDGGPSAATPRDGAATPSMLDTASTTNLKELGEELAAVAATAPAPGDGGGDDLASRRAYKLKFQDCISLFNKKPKKGIELLQKEGMLGTSVAHVATFLAKCKGLDKTMIGDYLGERDDYNIKVMHAYIDNLEFTELEFDAAIRLFLSGFRLPGEAQKIDRLMEKFAERYLKCNPGSFKSADVAYVLAYSTIMLNTDLHNPQVKKKMSKEGFLKNNRGINDGQDLPEEFMSGLYDRIQNNEIKMKEEGATLAVESAANQAKNMFTALLSIMGAFKQEQHSGPSDESIKSTLDYLHEKAKGSTAITVTESDAVRPMMEVIWAPLLGALSVSFDEYTVVQHINVCLQGITASCCLTALMGMTSLRDIFIHSLCGFTHLHSPHTMRFKNALAFKFLLLVASPERVGDHLQDQWVEVLRCISRWELLQQISSGMPTDAALFAVPNDRGVKAVLKKVFDNDSGVRSMDSLGMSELTLKKLSIGGIAASFRKGNDEPQVPAEVINSFDSNELNAVFLSSASLSSEAVVSFVRALCAVSHDELANVNAPRIFSLTRLVEVAHFNMNRIRLVWSRIWAVLSDYFIQVGCHSNLQVAKYAVDSLRQLAMKFLERDELANYTFQNDFLRPFVVIMRQSQAVEIRDLIIRCLSQMVLARVDNVKSGWKSMFMVFTTAAGDKEPSIVNLAFDTIEKIVRLHFNHITETETTTFTDCVNCLIAFTNNPHSSTVALNSIAFLRFCAVKLAEGAIGDVNALPEGLAGRGMPLHNLRVVALDAVPESASYNNLTTAQELEQESVPTTNFTDGSVSSAAAVAALEANLSLAANTPSEAQPQRLPNSEISFAMERPTTLRTSKSMGVERVSAGGLHARGEGGLRFVDRDEHVYFWFPLLAGLSELTFDPRDQIRNSALEVLFDTLKTHGGTFAASFWRRVFDSVLMPIFDHVRAEVTDTTTFTSEKKREKEDYWLYETCKRCLQHLIDVFVTFYDETRGLLPQVLQLLASFINRTHQSLAAGGVYALTHLTNSAATRLDGPAWAEVTAFMLAIAQDTAPNALELVTPPSRPQAGSQHTSGQPQSPQPQPEASPQGSTSGTGAEHRDAGATASTSRPAATSMNGWQAGAVGGAGPPGYSLREGIGARRLAKFRSQSTVQLLLVQCCSDVYSKQHEHMPPAALGTLMQALECIATHSRNTDSDTALRKRLAMQQAEDKVADDRVVFDPPLLRLETEAAHAYLSVLMHVFASGREDAARLNVTSRMVDLCRATLARFALGMDPQRVLPDLQYMSDARAKHQQLQAAAAETAAANGSRSGMLGGSGGGLLSGINLGNVNIGGVSIIGGKSAEAQRRATAYAAAVAAATQGRTADRKSIIVGRTSTGMLVLMAAPSVEYAPFATLINSTLAAVAAFDDATFRSHLHEFFPLMTVLITTDYAPAEVLRGLADLFAQRVGPIIGLARAEAAAEMAAAAAAARLQAEQQAHQVQALAQQQQQAAGSPVGT